MISYIKRKDLDINKYNTCIENSLQSRIYAFSWYLDIVADNWDVLVLDDYEAVMPIPWKRKFWIKYVTQPYFCQQLGIFSKKGLDTENEFLFLKKVKHKFLKINYSFNADNFRNHKKNKKINYTLPLDKDYETLFKRFNKGRKHAVKKAIKHELRTSEISIKTLINLKKENNYYGFDEKLLPFIKDIYSLTEENENGFLVGVFKNKKLLGGGFFLKSKTKIIYLFSSFNDEGRNMQASSFLINDIIKKYANSNLILDFEGGNLVNMSTFFKSFAASKETYEALNLRFLNL